MAKAKGFEIYEHLLFLDTELKMISEKLSVDPKITIKPSHYDSDKGAKYRFLAIFVWREKSKKSISGNIKNLPKFTNDEKKHLQTGKSLLTFESNKNRFPNIYMSRILNKSDPDSGILVGKIYPTYLFGLGSENSLPSNLEMTVYDKKRKLILISSLDKESNEILLQTKLHDSASRNFSFKNDSHDYVVSYWQLFTNFRFFSGNWVIYITQSYQDIIAPVSEFKKSYILFIFLTFLTVLLISLILIRKTLVPIEILRKGTEKITEGEIGFQVDIKSGDDFENLAFSFNEMSLKLKNDRENLAKMNQALRESEKHFRTILEISPIPLVISRLSNGTLLFINPQACKLFNIQTESAQKYNFFSFFINVKEKDRLIDNLKKFNNHLENYEICFKQPDGGKIHTLGTLNSLEYQDEQILFSGFIDITEKKTVEHEMELQRQKLIQADKMISLGILITGVAHEINNPNNFIKMNTPILFDAWKSAFSILDQYYKDNPSFSLNGIHYPEIKRLISPLFQGIIDGTERIENIINDLKNYARIDSTGSSEEFVSMNKVVQSSLELLNSMIKDSTDHFEVKYDENLPVVKGNFHRFEQVVINLVQNACQALDNKEKSIKLTTYYDSGKNMVIIKIIDEGVGIPSENLSHVMDPFFTSKRSQGGVGLGLSVSAGIIKDYQGEIKFDSQKGKGTIVSVLIPASLENKG